MVFINATYHPPHDKGKILLDYLSSSISRIQETHSRRSNIILGGDFNKLDISDLEIDSGLTTLTTPPTRGESTLDLIITNRPDLVLHAECVTPSLTSDHLAVLMKPRFRIPPIRRTVEFTHFQFKGYQQLCSLMESHDFSKLFTIPNIHHASEWLENEVLDLVAISFPTRRVSMSDRDPAWITPKAKWLMLQKLKARKKNNTIKFEDIDRKLAQMKIRAFANDPKQFWLDVDRVTHRKVSNKTFSHKNFDGNQLNKDLADRSSRGAQNHINSQVDFRPFEDKNPELTLTDVANALQTCKNSTPGPSDIPSFVFREYFDILTPLYHYLWNWSLKEGSFPHNYKRANLTAIPKVNNASTVDQIRGISITSIASRLFERTVHRKWILPSIVKLGDPLQFAYKPRLSTIDCLLTIQFFILNLLDCKTVDGVHLVLVDFSKAFDRMVQEKAAILFPRFISSPQLCQWLYDFTVNRQQRLIWCEEKLPYRQIDLGCSQGTAGGPNIFSMFTDDLKAKSDQSKIVKYSDDTSLIVPCFLNPNHDAKVALQTELENLNTITQNKELTINEKKSQSIRFCLNYHPVCKCECTHLRFDEVSTTNILGITFQKNCLFSKHVKSLITKLKRLLYVIRDLKIARTKSADIDTVFKAIIVSRIRYGISVYGSDPQTIAKLDAFLKKCYDKRYCTQHISASEILRSEDRRILHNILSNPCHPLLPFLQCNTKTRHTRHHFKNTKPFTQTITFHHSFVNRVCPF